MKKYLALLLVVAMLCMAMVGCGPAGNESTDGTGEFGADGREVAKDQIYNSIYSGEVNTLNYLASGTTNDLVVGANTIDPLVEHDPYGNIVPCGALSWESKEYEENGVMRQKWTFKLREGQYWVDKDGNKKEEVTAYDYVAALQYVCNAETEADNSYLVEDWVINASEYYAYTSAKLQAAEKGKEITSGENKDDYRVDANGVVEEATYADDGSVTWTVLPEVKAEDVGIKALDKYTLEYTLCNPRPYFVTALSFGCYWPASKTMLEQYGAEYATDNEKMWFNGAYILSTFKPEEQRIYTKNPHNWDAEHVYITEINQKCVDDTSNASNLYLNGEIDGCSVAADLLEAWRSDPKLKDQISTVRTSGDYSYFYTFNFDPRVAEVGKVEGITQADDDAWAVVVGNENFRKAIFHAINRVQLYGVANPDNYDMLIMNTITPKGQYWNGNKDYVTYEGLAKYTNTDSYDKDKAVDYMNKAKQELAGKVNWPVKIVVQNNGSQNWIQRNILLETGMEALFGKDTVDVINNQHTGSFLSGTRRNGNYYIQECNWGADYADPETWTDPFTSTNSYNHIDHSKDPAIMDLCAKYDKLVEDAKKNWKFDTAADKDARFAGFAKAEAFLIDHAIIIPYGISGGSYQCTKLNAFEGQYAGYGQSTSRYKGQKIYTTAMSQEQFDKLYADWLKQVADSQK